MASRVRGDLANAVGAITAINSEEEMNPIMYAHLISYINHSQATSLHRRSRFANDYD